VSVIIVINIYIYQYVLVDAVLRRVEELNLDHRISEIFEGFVDAGLVWQGMPGWGQRRPKIERIKMRPIMYMKPMMIGESQLG